MQTALRHLQFVSVAGNPFISTVVKVFSENRNKRAKEDQLQSLLLHKSLEDPRGHASKLLKRKTQKQAGRVQTRLLQQPMPLRSKGYTVGLLPTERSDGRMCYKTLPAWKGTGKHHRKSLSELRHFSSRDGVVDRKGKVKVPPRTVREAGITAALGEGERRGGLVCDLRRVPEVPWQCSLCCRSTSA